MLRSVLSQVRGITDLKRLFAVLGYHPADHPYDRDVSVVARWKTFKVVAAESPEARTRCIAIARGLANASAKGLVAALDPRGILVLAAPRIGQGGITHPLVVSLHTPSFFALQQLEQLRPQDPDTALAHALRVSEVLLGEAAGERFFAAFHAAVERMAAAQDRRHSDADRRLVALLALTRVLFLYFVQAKGWLDGRSNYLRNLLDRTLARRRNFHRSALHPLFFGTLNRPPATRSKRLDLGTIPYLNGGLFEPHPVERRLGPVLFANDVWRDTFDQVFERFRFCVREQDAVNAIAPDMLGRVFERLMDGKERRDTGTFYTPESVVRQIVDATIEAALTHYLTDDAAERVVHRKRLGAHDARVARKALDQIRLLDPAVGSGAFLLGALDALCEMRLALDPGRQPRNACALRRAILRKNLFGVDLNPIAVRLAELRLWLAVVADDPSERIAAVKPLPNLDGVVRQGDTLLDPLGAARRYGAHLASTSRDVRNVRTARHALFDARGAVQHNSQRRLRKMERALTRRLLDQALTSANHALMDLTKAARSYNLFGHRTGLTKTQRDEHGRWKRMRREAKRALRQLAEDGVPFFSFEVHLPDVVEAGGFTAVVGNPPWVRAEALPAPQRSTLRERFRWWRSSAARGFAHQPDLSVAFLERCLELVREGGAVGLLLPSKVVSAGYGERARRHLVRETSLAYIHRVPDADAARFGATTYPLALVVKKQRPTRDHTLQLGFQRGTRIAQQMLDVPGPWILVPKQLQRALGALRARGRPLSQIAVPVLGVKTGADRVFVGRLLGCDGGMALVALAEEEVYLETAVLRPALRGRDIRPFRAHPDRVILWGHTPSGTPLDALPSRATQYVRRNGGTLRRRSDDRDGAPWSVFRTRGAVAPHRVVWADLAKRPTAVALDESPHPAAIPLNTCYIAPAPDRESALVISAVLNSTWAKAYAAVRADEARGGYRRINARLAADMPIPLPGPRCTALAQLSESAHGADNPIPAAQLDEAVAEALGLSSTTCNALRALADDLG